MSSILEMLTFIEQFLGSSVGAMLTLSAYWSLTLFSCTLLSFPLIGVVILLRRAVPDRLTWLRAWLWGLLFLAPFCGKMRLWYEPPLIWRYTGFIYAFLGKYILARLIWPTVSAGLIFFRLIRPGRFRREIKNLPRIELSGTTVYLTPIAASPFAFGLLSPKIVIPKAYLEVMDDRELSDIITHERVHIGLGHLWIFTAWRLLCSLLFPNILLWLSEKYIREDMEALCDRVTMRRAKKTAVEYGRLILRSHRFSNEEHIISPAAFSGEKTYTEVKRRILRICRFKPYRFVSCLLLGLCCTSIIGGMLVWIRQASYPRWSRNNFVSIVDTDCHVKTFIDEAAIQQAFSWDKDRLTIHRSAYEALRDSDPNPVDTEHFWVCFDCFYKIPGIGGGGQLVEVDFTGDEEELIIPYKWTTDFWTELLRYI